LTGSTSGGASSAVTHPTQVVSTQARAAGGGVHVVASTEAGSIAAQAAGTDVITVYPATKPVTYVESSVSSRSSAHG